MTFALRALAVPVLLLAAACGGSGGSGMDASIEEADLRERLTSLLMAGVRDDVNAAAPNLALQEYAISTVDGKPPNVAQLTPAQRTELTRACFTQLQAFARDTNLDDTASIKAAVTAGSIQLLPKMSLAEVVFFAPRADGRGKPLRYVAKFTHYASDHQWRMSTIEEKFQ